MASTTFVAGTVIPVNWLNEVNALVWGSSSPPATPIRVNAAGAVGIGITPNSGWLSTRKPIQVGAFPALWEQSNGSTNLGFGLYEGGVNTFNYLTTGDAPTLYSQISGQHIWYRAPAGTAGNTVTLTESGRFDENGNFILAGGAVGIGGVPSTTYGLSSLWSYGSFVAASGQFNVHSTVSANYEFVHRATFGFDFYVNSGSTRVLSMTSAGDTLIRVNTAAPTLSVNQNMVFTLTSNTNLRISVRGTDGVTRVANITLA